NCHGEMGRTLLEQFPFLDAVFSGEVDYSFPEFIQCLAEKRSLDHLPGILSRAPDGAIIEGPTAPPVHDLENLPYRDFAYFVATRERLGLDKEFRLCLSLESSRGCWWGVKQHCTFCGLNALGMAYRQKSHTRFQQEVEATVRKYGARYLLMTDNILSMKYY